MTQSALAVMEQMMDAWQTQDWGRVTELFADSGSLEIVPIRAVYTGHDSIRSHLDEVAAGIESLRFDVKTLIAQEKTVTFERDDVFTYKGKDCTIPCVGILQIEGGFVLHWREYFDGMTMAKAMGMA